MLPDLTSALMGGFPNLTSADKGGGGVQNPKKCADIICERPLIQLLKSIKNLFCFGRRVCFKAPTTDESKQTTNVKRKKSKLKIEELFLATSFGEMIKTNVAQH